jgi:hypothetical protein
MLDGAMVLRRKNGSAYQLSTMPAEGTLRCFQEKILWSSLQ